MDIEKNEKLGNGLWAIGCVKRESANKFTVEGKHISTVWRDTETKKVMCDCKDFVENYKTDKNYRCRDIFAVKAFLVNTNPITSEKRLSILEQARDHWKQNQKDE